MLYTRGSPAHGGFRRDRRKGNVKEALSGQFVTNWRVACEGEGGGRKCLGGRKRRDT